MTSVGHTSVQLMERPALLDYEQLAEWLNDSVRHLRRLVDENRIPYIKVGHFVRFDPVSISDWLVANQRGSAG